MSEVCTYGGDAGEPIPGYAEFPLSGGTCCNSLNISRSALGSMTTLRWNVKVRFNELGDIAGQPIMAWGIGMAITGDRRLNISLVSGAFVALGDAPSEVSVPGLSVGTDVWLAARYTSGSGLCEYWYSYDDTFEEDFVTWIPLGAAQPGVTGTPLLALSALVTIGNWGIGAPGMGGRIYAASEWVDGVRIIQLRNENIPDDTHSSFPLTLGGTANVQRAVTEPNTFLSAYSSDGSTYGMGHYGLCDQGPTRSCSPARAGEVPLATGTPYSPDCEVATCG